MLRAAHWAPFDCWLSVHAGPADNDAASYTTPIDDSLVLLNWVQSGQGSVLGPFDCWLLMRGLETVALHSKQLSLIMLKQVQNAKGSVQRAVCWGPSTAGCLGQSRA